MKFLVVLALAVLGATAAPRDDVDVAGDVTAVIKAILDALPEPLLDIHGETASVDLGFEKLDFTAIDAVLAGVKNLEISTMDYDKATGRLDYELTIPSADLDVEFDLKLAGILDADNHPVIDVNLSDLKIAGYAVVDTSSAPHQVTDFKVLITLGGSKAKLTGVLNDDALSEKLSDVLSNQLPDIVNEITAQLEPAVSPIVKALINVILSLVG